MLQVIIAFSVAHTHMRTLKHTFTHTHTYSYKHNYRFNSYATYLFEKKSVRACVYEREMEREKVAYSTSFK